MFTPGATATVSVIVSRSLLGAVGLGTLDAIPDLRWGWLGRFEPPRHRPKFVRLTGTLDALAMLRRSCEAVMRDRGRLLMHRQAAFSAFDILSQKLARIKMGG